MTEYPEITNPIGHRLKLEMKKQAITSTELARRANVLTSFIYDIISGKSSNPSTLKLARVAEVLNINLAYLVNGMEKKIETSVHDSRNNMDNYVKIPYITSINSIDHNTNIISQNTKESTYIFHKEWIYSHLNTQISDLRIFTIDGDEMEPTLFHNDIVLIDTSRKKPSPPNIFVIFDGLGLTTRRIEYFTKPDGAYIRIISDNVHYSTYECSISDISIIGRVVWFSREI